MTEKRVKLVVCNEPQNCGIVKELEVENKWLKENSLEVKREELIRITNSRIRELENRLAEAEVFRNYLIALGHLNEDEDAYFCAYEEDCKKCTEKDWTVCLGYNVKLAAEKAEASLRGEAEDYVMLEKEEAEG